MIEAKKRQEGLSEQPTEAEIKARYPEFTQLLLDRERELLGREKDTRSHLDEQGTAGPGDAADTSINDTSADYFLKLANYQKRELIEIRQALERIRQNTYGICESCDQPIAIERLKNLPYARLCVDCQSSIERKHRVSRLSFDLGS